MKILMATVALLITTSSCLHASDSVSVGKVEITGLGQAVENGELCLGLGGATSLGGLIAYDGKLFECVQGKTNEGQEVATWVAYTKK